MGIKWTPLDACWVHVRCEGSNLHDVIRRTHALGVKTTYARSHFDVGVEVTFGRAGVKVFGVRIQQRRI
jgi:hypothetical protein